MKQSQKYGAKHPLEFFIDYLQRFIYNYYLYYLQNKQILDRNCTELT